MKLTAFRVQNYRSILDSGWVEVDDVTVVVGKNESGKTSLLKALWKFKPFKNEPYSLDREWPRGNRKAKSKDAPVITVRFNFTEDEKNRLSEIDQSAQDIINVEIQRTYGGSYYYSFLPKAPDQEHDLRWVVSVIEDKFGNPPQEASDHFKQQYRTAIAAFIKNTRDNGGSAYVVKEAEDFKNRLQEFVSPDESVQPHDKKAIKQLHQHINQAVQELGIEPPLRRAIDMAHEWLPTFIYMDDYKAFRGSAFIDQIKSRKDQNKLQEDDRTIMAVMEMAGLDLEEEFKKAQQNEREQRILDMNDASQTLTNSIADRWSQKKYEVMFQADGFHFLTFVKDIDGKALVPLEERSKGFQWFFSFDMNFMYETDGEFKNAIILLDEPGLHLHAAAQRDLLRRMKAYASDNQLVYTTHLPFMIDFTRLDNIWIAEERGKEGTKIHKDWAVADKDARFTLQAALGLNWSQSLFVGSYNLVVEGITDFWYLTTISTILKDAGEAGLDDELVITPAGGASKVAYVATILCGQELDVAVLLDSDPEGKSAYEQLVHQWILADKNALMLGQVLGIQHNCALEDLFSEDYYMSHVNEAYRKELNGQTLALPSGQHQSIVHRVEEGLAAKGISPFNKGRVAKRIMTDLAKKSLTDLSPTTVENYRKVITGVNEIVARWRHDK